MNTYNKKSSLLLLALSLFVIPCSYTMDKSSKIAWGVSARQGLRETMEDTHTVYQKPDGSGAVFAVFDGHGGKEAAEIARNDFGAAYEKCQHIDFPHRLNALFAILEEKIITQTTAGTTALVADWCKPNKLYLAWAGDSRGIVIRDGTPVATTKDHKPSSPSEARRLSAANIPVTRNGAWRVFGELAVSRALGNRNLKNVDFLANCKVSGPGIISDPEIIELTVQPHDYVVLACDGLWDVYTNNRVTTLIETYKRMAPTEAMQNFTTMAGPYGEVRIEDGNNNFMITIARALRDNAIKQGSTDNVSVMVIQIPEESTTTGAAAAAIL